MSGLEDAFKRRGAVVLELESLVASLRASGSSRENTLGEALEGLQEEKEDLEKELQWSKGESR